MKLYKNARRFNIHGIGAKMIGNSILVIALIMIMSFVAIYYTFSVNLKNNIKSELLKKVETICALESGFLGNADEYSFNPEHIRIYETLTDANIMHMDVATMMMEAEYNNDKRPVDIVQLDSVTSERDYQKHERFYIIETLETYFFKQILSGQSVADIRQFTFSKDDVIVAGAPLRNNQDEIVGGIVLIRPTTVLHEQTNMMLRVILMVGAAGFFLAIVMAVTASKNLVDPLIGITEGTRRMVDGNYGELINIYTGTELDALAGTLNTLSQRLDDTFKNLCQEKDKLNLIMNSIDEGIIAVDWYMNVLHCNQTFMEMLAVNKIPDSIGVDTQIGKALHDSMRQRESVKCEWTDESGRHLKATASPFSRDGRLIIGAVCLVHDISEAERLEQLRRDYVANISHELRTPLTGIRGMVEPLMDGIFETEQERQDCYKIIYNETVHLEKLIGDMLDISRLQDGRVIIDMEPLEVDEILKSALRRVERTAESAGVALNLELEGDHIACMGNEDRILQVATVFLDNALRFTPTGGSITVTAREIGKCVRISVRDTGCGIEPKDLPYIWDRFYKVDKSRMRTPGTGLGLAIAKLIVQLMHGEIGVISQPEKGAEFWFTLNKA